MAHFASHHSFSSSDSEFDDDSDGETNAEQLGLGNYGIDQPVNDAKAKIESSQFQIDDEQQHVKAQPRRKTEHQNIKTSNSNVMHRIDDILSDDNINKQTSKKIPKKTQVKKTESSQFQIDKKQQHVKVQPRRKTEHQHIKPSNSNVIHRIDDILSDDNINKQTSKKIPKEPQVKKTAVGLPPLVTSQRSFHEIMGTPSRNAAETGHKSQISKQKSKNRKTPKMTKMSILERTEPLQNSAIRNSSRRNFQSIPMNDFGNDKLSHSEHSKPSNLNSIADQYMFNSKSSRSLSSSLPPGSPETGSSSLPTNAAQDDYETLIATSNALLKSNSNMTGGGNHGNEAVVFAYDEQLHDFVPAASPVVETHIETRSWWQKDNKSLSTKNIEKMIRFSSDHHRYGLTNENENGHSQLKSNFSMDEDEKNTVKSNRRAAYIFILFSMFLSVLMLIALSLWIPWTHEEVGYTRRSQPELDDEKPNNPIPDDSKDYSATPTIIGNFPPGPSPNQSPPENVQLISKEDLVEVVKTVSPETSILILKDGTVQFKGARWLVETDPLVLKHGDSLGSHRLIQRFLLAVLYFALNGETKWTNRSEWMSESHECEWHGISCIIDEDMNLDSIETRAITGIDLSENGLSGSLPPEIGVFDSLKSLWLNENKITGKIPIELLNVETLLELYLNDNQMTGDIPTGIGLLKNLEGLDLSKNRLEGKIPNGIGNMENLADLRLSKNFLTGEFPVEILDLRNIHTLRLEDNSIEGEISDIIGGLKSLEILRLSSNELYGSIPTGIGELSNLRELYLEDCDFNGPIPTTIENLKSLKKLYLSKNNLSSEIPREVGSMENLVAINLSYNDLQGDLPPEVGNLKNLEMLFLESNGIVGNIPISYQNLGKIKKIHLEENNLSGPIPKWIGQLNDLEELGLSNNNFTGEIPILSPMKSLDMLKLEKNSLSGIMPDGICSLDLSVLTADCKIECLCCTSCTD